MESSQRCQCEACSAPHTRSSSQGSPVRHSLHSVPQLEEGGPHGSWAGRGPEHAGGFPKLGVPTIMENQMEKKMKNEMETGAWKYLCLHCCMSFFSSSLPLSL